VRENRTQGSARGAPGNGRPYLNLDVKDVVTKLTLRDEGRITPEVFVDQSHVTVVGVTGAIAVVAEVEEFGELGHRREGMIVVEWIGAGPPRSGARGSEFRGGAGWIDFWLFHGPAILLQSRPARPIRKCNRPEENRVTSPRSGLVQHVVGGNGE